MVNAEEENTLYSVHLSRELRIQVAKAQIKQMTGSEVTSDDGSPVNDGVRKIGQEIFKNIFDRPLPPLKGFKGMTEKIYLSELIRQCNGDITAILKKSELSRSHFYSLLKKYGLSL